MLAVFAPIACRVKCNSYCLDAPAARLWPDACQVDFANWDASVPVIAIVPIVRLADPVFVIVKTWVGLALEAMSAEPKALEAGVIEIFGQMQLPLPVRPTVRVGLSASFDGMESAGSLCSQCLTGQM